MPQLPSMVGTTKEPRIETLSSANDAGLAQRLWSVSERIVAEVTA